MNRPRPGIIPTAKVNLQANPFLQEQELDDQSELNRMYNKTAEKYNAVQSVRALGKSFGNDVIVQLMKEIYSGDDNTSTEDPYKGNFL